MKTVELKYSLLEKVRLIEIDRPGFVDSIIIDSIGIQYRVCHWFEGERRTVWCHEQEIEKP